MSKENTTNEEEVWQEYLADMPAPLRNAVRTASELVVDTDLNEEHTPICLVLRWLVHCCWRDIGDERRPYFLVANALNTQILDTLLATQKRPGDIDATAYLETLDKKLTNVWAAVCTAAASQLTEEKPLPQEVSPLFLPHLLAAARFIADRHEDPWVRDSWHVFSAVIGIMLCSQSVPADVSLAYHTTASNRVTAIVQELESRELTSAHKQLIQDMREAGNSAALEEDLGEVVRKYSPKKET